MKIQAEEAFEFLVRHLCGNPAEHHAAARLVSLRYSHLYLPDVVANFWRTRTPNIGTADLSDAQYTVFYDASLGASSDWRSPSRTRSAAQSGNGERFRRPLVHHPIWLRMAGTGIEACPSST